MFSPKKKPLVSAATEWSSMPRPKNDPRVITAWALVTKLELQLKENQLQLERAPSSDSGPPPQKIDLDSMAQRVLDGESVENLVPEVFRAAREKLFSARRILTRALELQRGRAEAVTGLVVAEICQQIAPLSRAIAEEVIAAGAAFQLALKRQYAFFGELGARSVKGPGVPWRSWPFEDQVFFGGNNCRITPLEFYLDQKRKVWNLPKEL